MDNKLVIDVNDNRDKKVIIQKLNEAGSEKEASELIKDDIETTCEGLMSLLSKASEHDISDEERNIRYVLAHLIKTYPDNDYIDVLKDIVYNQHNNTSFNKRLERVREKAKKKGTPKRSKTLRKNQ